MRHDRLRPVDLAREHDLSAQAIRNYEDAGILPRAPRGSQGYRRYTPIHAQALRAFLTLRPGYGNQVASDVLRAANAGDVETVFRLIDHGHASIRADRGTLDEVAQALDTLTTTEPAAPTGHSPTIGALAHQLNLHPATLRKWEHAGILHPDRDPATGYRRYPPGTVRDAHLAHQLRRGGYLLEQIAAVTTQLREAGGITDLQDTLRTWRDTLHQRSRAMLDGAAQLATYLHQLGQ